MLLDRIRQIVQRVAPLAVCEVCIAIRLQGSASEVHLALNELAVETGFDRKQAACALCGEESRAVAKVR